MPRRVHVEKDTNTLTEFFNTTILCEDAIYLASGLISKQVTVFVVAIGPSGVGVGVENKLLSRYSRLWAMFTTVVCVGLVHAAVDAGSADGARSSGVVSGV